MDLEKLKKLGMAAAQDDIRLVMFTLASEPEIILAAYYEIERLKSQNKKL